MELGLQNKVAVITGGTSGIGKAIAEEFAKEGCRIAICGTKADKLERAIKQMEAQGCHVFGKVVDVASYEEVQTFADEIVAREGSIDVWVNNAGIMIPASILDVEPADWTRVINVNLSSVMWGIKAAGNYMKKQGGGVILNSSSFSGRISISKRASYTASKGGMNALIRLAAGALAPYNIRINGVAAGSVMTDIQAHRSKEDLEKAVAKISMQRMGELDEIAKVYVYLGSEAASYITGEVLEVTGGKMCIQDTEVPWLEK